MTCFEIASRKIGPGAGCLVIAEMGLGHDGSLGAAHSFIDAAAEAGAGAVKFQTHLADAESTPQEKFRVPVFPQDATRQDYWRRTQFTEPQWAALKQHADRRGLVFLSSPFSIEAVQLLTRIGIPAWKIASGETNNLPMLDAMCATRLPFLVSTGMSYWSEVDAVVALMKRRGVPLALFQCTSKYPCPPESLGLNLIGELQKRYDLPVGFSDHSGRVCSGLAACCLGACAVEVHVTFSRKCFGPDVPASLTFEELHELAAGIRFIEAALAHPVDKDAEARGLEAVRALFTKSLVLTRSLPAGAKLAPQDLTQKKPGQGIPAAEADRIAGRTLRRAVQEGAFLAREDLESE